MASRTLYPPIVNSFEPAFIAGFRSQLKVYFSLSSLSEIPAGTELTVQASIVRKDGVKVLNTENDIDNERYRATGIILNLVPQKDESLGNNYYYVVINNDDLKSEMTLGGTTYKGWIPGWIYKIQLRLSTVKYPGEPIKQAAWLQEYSNSFSEWSTICYTKAISEMALQIPLFGYDSTDKTGGYDPLSVYSLIEVNFFGSLSSSIPEADEEYEYCQVYLYKDNELIEDSGQLFKTELSSSYFGYNFQTNFIENEQYELRFTYCTENGYQPSQPFIFKFDIFAKETDRINAEVISIDNDTYQILNEITSIDLEENEGRIGLKVRSDSIEPYSGNICVRRASQQDNFQTWSDIHFFTLKQQDINELPVFYDYTIESGVWYKYGVQSVTTDGDRGILVEMTEPIQRLFNHSYLLGQNEQQLKLSFDNTVSSFKIQVVESKTETIGSKYPFITRNAAVRYRTFSLNGLISFWMDDNHTFTESKQDIYKYPSIVEYYKNFNLDRNILQNDYTYERDFRKLVLDFLMDGKPKLYKSPTEGNIIIRLTDINCSPNQTVDRLIYSFSGTATEIDDATMDNYLSYGFCKVGTYSTDLAIETTHLGQLEGPISVTDNILKLIYEKYDSQDKNYAGFRHKLKSVSRIKITITDPALRIKNNGGEFVLGNNLKVVNAGHTSIITVYDPIRIYEFDSLITFYYQPGTVSGNDELYLLGDEEGLVSSVNATIDFLYNLSIEPYTEHDIEARRATYGIGQFFEEVAPSTSIYNLLYYKYYIESSTKFRYLYSLPFVEIEADPHTVFAIKTDNDTEVHQYEVNDTGVLRLYEIGDIVYLNYVGRRYILEGQDDSQLSEIITIDTVKKDYNGNDIVIKAAANVIITYKYRLMEGQYRK